MSFAVIVAMISLIYVGPSLISGSTRVMTVMSGSMSPEIGVGDVIITKTVDPASIRVGDIITYAPRSYGIVITHRVVDIDEAGDFVTKGDAVEDVDINTVKPDQVIGKHDLTIPLLGYLLHYAHQPIGFVILIVLPVILLIASELKSIINSGNEKQMNIESEQVE
jgi:signal peptidase